MKKILILAAVFFASLALINCMPVHGEEKIYESVVRLHVVANSDSEADQALKLRVRDAVLAATEGLLDGCFDRESALGIISDNLALIEETALETVRAEGYDYTVKVSLGREKYPTKSYESICFPAGTYESLRILIGGAEGQNWWCVMFPQLCLAGARRSEQAFIEVGLTPEQYRVITETEDAKYKVRFKILEIIEEAIGGN